MRAIRTLVAEPETGEPILAVVEDRLKGLADVVRLGMPPGECEYWMSNLEWAMAVIERCRGDGKIVKSVGMKASRRIPGMEAYEKAAARYKQEEKNAAECEAAFANVIPFPKRPPGR